MQITGSYEGLFEQDFKDLENYTLVKALH